MRAGRRVTAPRRPPLIKQEVEHFAQVRDEIKLASGDLVDMKQFEPGMRQMLDLWVDADPSETLMDFEELGLLELIIQRGPEALDGLPKEMRDNQESMAEATETTCAGPSSMRTPVNPNTTRMSVLLELIDLRRQQAISYGSIWKRSASWPEAGEISTEP